MRVRRETAEHPFATLKMRMGATHFLMKTLPRVATTTFSHNQDPKPPLQRSWIGLTLSSVGSRDKRREKALRIVRPEAAPSAPPQAHFNGIVSPDLVGPLLRGKEPDAK
jgi:hypothetical protein